MIATTQANASQNATQACRRSMHQRSLLTRSTGHASAPPPTGGHLVGAAPAPGDLAGHPVSEPAPLRMPDNLIADKRALHIEWAIVLGYPAPEVGYPIRSPPGPADAYWSFGASDMFMAGWEEPHDRIGSWL